jgi:hypothetical protein
LSLRPDDQAFTTLLQPVVSEFDPSADEIPLKLRNAGRNVASIRPYGDKDLIAVIPFMAITETFQFSSSRSDEQIERRAPHRESSVTRIASICLTGQAPGLSPRPGRV